MPNLDGTGPRGMGPMTGRGMGYCAQPIPPFINPNPQVNPYMLPVPPMPFYPCGRGRGLPLCGPYGRGRGFGRGWGRW